MFLLVPPEASGNIPETSAVKETAPQEGAVPEWRS
jgi:hypothetical protein